MQTTATFRQVNSMILQFRSVAAALLPVLSLSSFSLQADEEVQVGRYSSIRAVPTESQQDVFQTIATIEFPDDVVTVGDAVKFSIKEQGFRLAAPSAADPAMQFLLDLPLPSAHRKLGPMSLKSALETLAGPVWRVVQDPVHRLVGFELCKDLSAGSDGS